MNNNPSPGNKAGGLTTILEKSLGAAAKGGTTAVQRGLQIRRTGHRQGLRVHGHAGYDPVSATGQVAGGANVLAFTTGAAPPTAASRRRRSSSPPTAIFTAE